MASRMAEYEGVIRAVDLGRVPAADAFRSLISDLDRRVAKAEAVSVDATAAIQELRDRGLAIITETITPSVEQAKAAVAQATGYLASLQAEGLPGGLVALDPIESLPGVTEAQTAFEALAAGLAALDGVLAAISALGTAVDGKAPAGHTHPTTSIDGLDPALAALAAAAAGGKTRMGSASDTSVWARTSALYGFVSTALSYTAAYANSSCVAIVVISGSAQSATDSAYARSNLKVQANVPVTNWTDVSGVRVAGPVRALPVSGQNQIHPFFAVLLVPLTQVQKLAGAGWSVAALGQIVDAGSTLNVYATDAVFLEFPA